VFRVAEDKVSGGDARQPSKEETSHSVQYDGLPTG